MGAASAGACDPYRPAPASEAGAGWSDELHDAQLNPNFRLISNLTIVLVCVPDTIPNITYCLSKMNI